MEASYQSQLVRELRAAQAEVERLKREMGQDALRAAEEYAELEAERDEAFAKIELLQAQIKALTEEVERGRDTLVGEIDRQRADADKWHQAWVDSANAHDAEITRLRATLNVQAAEIERLRAALNYIADGHASLVKDALLWAKLDALDAGPGRE